MWATGVASPRAKNGHGNGAKEAKDEQPVEEQIPAINDSPTLILAMRAQE